MSVEEILRKIEQLSAEERAILRRELGCLLSKPETQDVTPEISSALHKEQQASHDERGLPVEDVVSNPKDQA